MNMKQYVKPETTSFQTTPNSTLCATSTKVGVELGTMKVKSIFTSILGLVLMLSGMLLLSSCQNGNGDVRQPAPTFKKGEVVTITTNPIGVGNKTPRKVHIGSEDNDKKEAQMVWTAGDQLRVIVKEGDDFHSSDFVLTDGANNKIGTFTGTMPANGSEFFLAYPCGEVTGSKYDNGVFTFQGVSVPNVQDFNVGETSFNSGLMPVVGYGGKDDNGTLTGTTTIVGGALRVKLTNNTSGDLIFNKIKLYVLDALTKEDGEHTSVWSSGYTVNYDVSTGAVTPSGTTADNNIIVLNLSDKVTLAKEATSDYFYFVMLAPLYFNSITPSGATTQSSFTVYLYNQDGEVTKTDELDANKLVATTSFNYNIAIAPGDIVEGTLEMKKITN